jgi:hypothetical protein
VNSLHRALDYGITPAIIIGRLMKIADELGTSPNWLLGVSLASVTDPEIRGAYGPFRQYSERHVKARN